MFQLLSRLPSLLSCCRWPRPWPGTPGGRHTLQSSTPPPSGPAAPGEPGPPADDRPPGCGWFDSTYELSQGLLVCEHGDDTAAHALATLPLSDWLQHQLRGWQPGAGATQA